MKKLISNPNDLKVQQIIQKILIRNGSSNYDYTRKQPHQLTSQQHLWHYRLQQQNLQLKEKIKNLRLQFKKKMERHNKCLTTHKEIQNLRLELANVLKSNAQLQEEINQMRLRTNQINESIQQSLDFSIKNRKHNRSCSCHSIQHNKSITRRNKAEKVQTEERSLSPEKEILKVRQDVGVFCVLDGRKNKDDESVKIKRQHIKALKRIVENQEKLMVSYSKEIDQKKGKEMLSKQKTMQSTSRLMHHIQRATSHNILKPLSSAGSIIKIKRQ